MYFTVSCLKEVFPLAEFLSDAFGPVAEIAIHDLHKPNASIVFIRNGHLSGRKKGDSMTKETMKLALQADKNKVNFISDYRGMALNDHEFRVSSYFIRNHENQLIGVLCINVNITEVQQVAHFLQKLSETDSATDLVVPSRHKTRVDNHPEKRIRQITRDIIKRSQIPIENLTRIERLNVIKTLKERGVFMIKGAVGIVAPELNISVPTLYRYLQTLK